MSSQKIGGLKVPKFDKANYNLLKKRMLLYLIAADHRYIKVIKKGPFVFEIEDPNDDEKRIPKNPDDYTEKDIELDSLDAKVHHLLMESMDDDMSHQIVACENAKHMWQTIELLLEGTEDVRENRLDILTTQYKAFKSLPGENMTSVFERLNKLINELSIYGKRYEQKEINRKFMLTLPTHLISKEDSVRERLDFKTMSLDKLYGKMNTHEMELEHKKIIYGTSKHKDLDINTEKPKTNDQVLYDAEVDDGNLSRDPRDYYTIEELQDMKDPTMANMAVMFGNLRFRRKQAFRGSGSSNRGQKSPSYSDSGYKTGMVDRKNVKSFNCGEMGHFATECRRSQQARDKGKAYQRKDSGGSKKYPMKSYLAEGRSWDDTDDEEEQFGNLALMDDTPHSSRQVIICSYSPPFHTENLCENEHCLAFRKSITIPTASSFDSIKVECTEKTCIDRYNSINLSYYHCIVSLKNANGTVGDLKENVKKLQEELDKLVLKKVNVEDIRQKHHYLELKANNHVETITQRDEKIKELEAKLQAYANSANLAKELISSQVVSGKLGIGLDYDELRKSSKKRVVENEKVEKVNNPPDTPHVLKNAKEPLYKKASSDPFDEDRLFIEHELLIEDLNELKDKKAKESSKSVDSDSETSKAGLGFSSKTKRSRNRNGRIGGNGPRKLCNNCGSAGHLTHACRKAKVDNVKNVNMHKMSSMPKSPKCNNSVCMPCVVNFVNTYLNSTHSHNSSHNHDKHVHTHTGKSKTVSPPKVRKEAPVTKPRSKSAGASVSEKGTVKDNRELVRGLPEMEFCPEGLCEACEKGKSKRASHKKKTVSDIAEPLQLLHMDLFGPVNVISMSRKKYCLVIVDDYSRYTWVLFLHSNNEAAEMIIDHINMIELEAGVPVRCIRSDNGTEFKNAKLNDFCVEKGISRQYSAPRTPQQNGVVERKNRTLVEAARAMLNEANLPTYFWAEAVSTACYTQNRTLINKMFEKIPYELMANKKPSVSYFHVFGEKCYVLKDHEHLGKFDTKAEEGIFLGYSLESKAYRVFMIDDRKVVESLNVTFDDTKLPSIQKEDSNDHLSVEDLSDDEDEPEFVLNRDNNGDDHHNDHNGDSDSDGNGGDGSDMNGNSGNTIVHSETVSGNSPQVSDSTDQDGSNSGGVEQERGSASRTQQNVNQAESSRANLPRAVKWSRSHPEDLIIGDAGARVQTRRATANECLFLGFFLKWNQRK
ncbi:uncharacterized protein LOC141718736 [Apium graveolens]|uniref:uncharacterized protein LOC141718736 n=1 Tax=Apium graveolens TaxID=4045 RepID=UPI003D7A25E0